MGFELLGITSDLGGLLRRCTTQVAPCGPHRFVPCSPTRVRLRCKQGMGIRNFLAWAASQHDDRRPSVDLRRHTSKGSGCGTDYADLSCSKPMPCRKFVSTSAKRVLRDAPLRARSGPVPLLS